MEDNNHEQAHTQYTSTGAPQNFNQVATRAYVNQIGRPVDGASSVWGDLSRDVANFYYSTSANTNSQITDFSVRNGLLMDNGATRIINPGLDELKDTVAALKKELEDMKEKLKTTNSEKTPEFRKISHE